MLKLEVQYQSFRADLVNVCTLSVPVVITVRVVLKEAKYCDDLHRRPLNRPRLSFNTAKIHQKIPATRCHFKCRLFV